MARVGVKPPSQSEGRCTDAHAVIRPAHRSIRSHVTMAGYICGTEDGSDVSIRCPGEEEWGTRHDPTRLARAGVEWESWI